MPARPIPLTPEQRSERARKAGLVAQSPETLAARLVRDWPTLSLEQRRVLRALLQPVLRGDS